MRALAKSVVFQRHSGRDGLQFHRYYLSCQKNSWAEGVQNIWPSEESWRIALWIAYQHLRLLEEQGCARDIYNQRRRFERTLAEGLPQWREQGLSADGSPRPWLPD
jgi:hypothetical protein